ncbi:tyrosine-type recombinase/integrase [Hamadaea tsunoensis]|uniref:tyrosine-type recombinase/integrase n=1 Tax=Hamadaea tsunoensis TaxID=53368 RepID=UPI000487E79D|nr:site-specific integrase [Hamadaea tsunoensis]
MANKKGKRQFGSIRRRASGRFQARYVGPDGIQRSAPHTFATEAQARKWLTLMESEIIKQTWEAPEKTEITLSVYGTRWIAERKLAPRTRENYQDLFRLYINPHLGHLTLDGVRPSTIRTWRQKLLAAGTPEPQAVKAYVLLRAIFNTAIKPDKILRENPCQIDGYDRYETPERVPATLDQVLELAERMPSRYRALVLVAAFSSLRWGELAALRRRDVDLADGTLRVQRKLAALRTGPVFGPPKSKAGNRVVTIPTIAVEPLREHMAEFVGAELDAIIFTGDKGAYLRSGNFLRTVKWAKLRADLGLPANFTFHDLRHTGNGMASASGANLRELMRRMGHSSTRAALIYLHGSPERDREIAEEMDRKAREAEERKRRKDATEDDDEPEAS